MLRETKTYGIIILLTFLALVAGCGGGGGGGSSNGSSGTQSITLEDVTVPSGFNFLTTKTVNITIESNDHGISEDAFVKITLDQDYQYTLFLGALEDGGDFSMSFTVPGRISTLYYKVYKAGATPVEGQKSV